MASATPSPWARRGPKPSCTVSRSRRAKVQNGALQDLSTSKRGGLGVRVLRCGPKGLRTGIATSTDLTRADFQDLFAQAWQLSALGDEDPWIRQAEPSGADDLPSRHDPRGDALTAEQRIGRAMALEAEARKASAQGGGGARGHLGRRRRRQPAAHPEGRAHP